MFTSLDVLIAGHRRAMNVVVVVLAIVSIVGFVGASLKLTEQELRALLPF